MSKLKLEIIESDSNYVATIVKLPELKRVDGLDNLMVANVFGYNCLVSKDADKDIPYIFFPAECVIAPEFLSNMNYFRNKELNMDKESRWFFEDSWRVKAIKFKWIVSSGFLTPVTFLWTWADYVKVGDTFHKIGGQLVCWKYRRPVAPERLSKQQRMSKRLEKFDIVIPNQFRFHNDTPQFLRFLEDFKEGDSVVITEKLHWTSAVFSNVLTKSKLSILERIAKRIWVRVRETEYYHLYSSRTVIKNDDIDDERNKWGGYYWENLWWMYAKLLEGKIEKGITLYGEIVGYTPSGGFIQKGYNYGCKSWESKFYVYRITYTTPDGIVIEFTDSQISQYCSLRAIDVVPTAFWFDRSAIWWEDLKRYDDDWFQYKWNPVEFSKDMCILNNLEVPREWVVIRRDGQETYSAYKLKSQLFLGYETAQIDAWAEDTEENS